MNKKIIAAAIAASIAAPAAMAGDNVTVYGKVRQSLDFAEVTKNSVKTKDQWEINDRSSRLGFKGSEDLGNGLKAIYQIEFNVKASDNSGRDIIGGSTAIKANRNQFVGLAGDFGTVLIGRHDAPHNLAWKKTNIFGDTISDFKTSSETLANTPKLGSPIDWERVDGTVAYISPSFSGLTVAGAIVPIEVTPTYDGLAEAYSLAAMYSNAGLYVGAGMLSHAIDDNDEWNLTVAYSMDAFTVGVTYEDAEMDVADTDQQTWLLSGSYAMGNNVLKAQIWDADNDDADHDQDGWAIGLDHNFSKRTQAQFVYEQVDGTDNTATGIGSSDTFSIGLNHNF